MRQRTRAQRAVHCLSEERLVPDQGPKRALFHQGLSRGYLARMNENRRVLMALALAIIGGVVIAAMHSASLLAAADGIAPIGTLWVNAIRMTVIPLVVSLLITGIASAADIRAVGRLGARTILVFVLMLVAAAAIVVPLAPSLFALLPNGARPTLPPGAAEAAQLLASDQKQTLASWLTSLIPTNPVAAAANGAMMPLVIFSVFFALAIVRSQPASRAALVAFFQAIADAMLVLVRWIILLAPVGVFALVLPLAARAGGALAGAIGFYIVAYSTGSIVTILLCYPVAAAIGGVPIRKFGKAVLPAQLIAFSSSSSIATLPAMIECAEDGLQLPERITGFVLPLAASTFKLAGPVSWTVGALFVGWFYNVPLHAPQLATIALAAVFLTFGVPGVPRGAFIMLAPLFLAIGLPVEGIGLLIAVDAMPDTFATVLNVMGDLTAAVLVNRFARAGSSPQQTALSGS
jgi:proton glutamate symport protein